jgi:hypothetical protein
MDHFDTRRNIVPEPVRRYIHDLATRVDPASAPDSPPMIGLGSVTWQRRGHEASNHAKA